MSEPLADLEYDVTDHVATITINRPDALQRDSG